MQHCSSQMTLNVDNDAVYLALTNAKSKIAVHFYSSSVPLTMPPPINTLILVARKTLQHVVSSAAEAETAGAFLNS